MYLKKGEFIFPLSDVQYEQLLSLSSGFTEFNTTRAHFILSHLQLSYCSIFHSITFQNYAILQENKRQNKQKHRDGDEKENKGNMRESKAERKGGEDRWAFSEIIYQTQAHSIPSPLPNPHVIQ